MAPMKWTKRILVVVVLLAVIAGAAVAAAPMVGRWYVRDRVLPAVAKRLGRDLSVRSITVEYRRVVLEGVVLSSQQDANRQPMAQIPRITVEYEPWDLLGGEPTIISVEVYRPVVRLLRRADGGSNFLDLLTRREASVASSGGKVRLRDLRVRQARGYGDLIEPIDIRLVDDRSGRPGLRPGG